MESLQIHTPELLERILPNPKNTPEKMEINWIQPEVEMGEHQKLLKQKENQK